MPKASPVKILVTNGPIGRIEVCDPFWFGDVPMFNQETLWTSAGVDPLSRARFSKRRQLIRSRLENGSRGASGCAAGCRSPR